MDLVPLLSYSLQKVNISLCQWFLLQQTAIKSQLRTFPSRSPFNPTVEMNNWEDKSNQILTLWHFVTAIKVMKEELFWKFLPEVFNDLLTSPRVSWKVQSILRTANKIAIIDKDRWDKGITDAKKNSPKCFCQIKFFNHNLSVLIALDSVLKSQNCRY